MRNSNPESQRGAQEALLHDTDQKHNGPEIVRLLTDPPEMPGKRMSISLEGAAMKMELRKVEATPVIPKWEAPKAGTLEELREWQKIQARIL